MTDRLGRIERVFFVDDSEDEAFISRSFFKRQDVRAELTHFFDFDALRLELDELSATALWRSLVIVDFNLTLANGTEGIIEMRREPRYEMTLVGICSGSEDPADQHAAAQAGADFFVAKPLDASCLATICGAIPSLNFTKDDAGVALYRDQ